MIRWLYERLTGGPWRTRRSCAAEFGPPPGALYAEALRHYTDAELILHGEAILADLRGQEAAMERIRAHLLDPPPPSVAQSLSVPAVHVRAGATRDAAAAAQTRGSL